MSGANGEDGDADRVQTLLIALLVLFAPAAILALTLAFLSYTGNLLLGRLTLLELLELYLIDLLLLSGAGYLLYRLLGRAIGDPVPDSLDEADENGDERADEGRPD
jgi:hypothetical protein